MEDNLTRAFLITLKSFQNNIIKYLNLLFKENSIRIEKSKNIYWNYKEETAIVKWLDDHTVDINGHEIDVRVQTFDWRR